MDDVVTQEESEWAGLLSDTVLEALDNGLDPDFIGAVLNHHALSLNYAVTSNTLTTYREELNG